MVIFGHFLGPKGATRSLSPLYTPLKRIRRIPKLEKPGPIPDPTYLETLFGFLSKNIDFWGFLTFLTKIIDFGSGPHSRPPVYRSDNRLVSF